MNKPNLDELATLITRIEFFNSIPASRIAEILPYLTYFELPKDSVLFHQGAASDAVYILLKGSAIAYFLTSSGETKLVGSIEAFETIGELGVLSLEPRSLTVKTVAHAEFLEISSDLFKKLCEEFPAMLFHILQPVISRSLNTLKLLQTEKKPDNYLFFPAEPKLNINSLKSKLGNFITKTPHSKIKMDWVEAGFYDPFEKFDEDENFLYINFVDENTDPYSFHKIVAKSKHFYMIADGTKEMKIDNFAQKVIDMAATDSSIKLNLILLYPEKTKGFPRHTSKWLKKYNFFLYHHVREDSEEDHQRLFRFLNRTPIGLVLGGGGVRGLAHVGVLKALIDKKIPIDMIGGTSIGALAACLYAWIGNYQDTENYFRWALDKCFQTVSWRKLTWPIISLYSADPITTAVQSLFHDNVIENLWLPFFCISSNLSSRHEAIHNKGLMWQTLRASASLPAVVPPVVMNGDLHMDGGLLNNLPVDVMRNFLGPTSIIIASKLSSPEADKKQYCFPSVLTWKESILYKLRFAHKEYRFPAFLDMFMNSILLGSSQREDNNAFSANILINPDLRVFRTMTRKKAHENYLIKLGYDEAMRVLALRDNEI